MNTRVLIDFASVAAKRVLSRKDVAPEAPVDVAPLPAGATTSPTRLPPLSVALEGLVWGAELDEKPDPEDPEQRPGPKPAAPERARALGAFVEELLRLDEEDGPAFSAAMQQHLLGGSPELFTEEPTPELVRHARLLIVRLHTAFLGNVDAQRDITAAVAAIRTRKSTKPHGLGQRRAHLVALLEKLRSGALDGESLGPCGPLSFRTRFVGELIGLDPSVAGRGEEALTLVPDLRAFPTAVGAAARLASRLNMFGDGERGERQARKLFALAVRQYQKR